VRNYLVDTLPVHGIDPDRILTHDTSTRADKLALFKQSRGLVMISPSFDRGVDLPNDECRCVIICKMPYLSLADKQVKARLAMPKGQRWYNLRAIQTVMQMTGRAVRNKEDFCDTYILDKQFNSLLARTQPMLPKWWLEAIRREES
jgi:Rad3-related DNA helicase